MSKITKKTSFHNYLWSYLATQIVFLLFCSAVDTTVAEISMLPLKYNGGDRIPLVLLNLS